MRKRDGTNIWRELERCVVALITFAIISTTLVVIDQVTKYELTFWPQNWLDILILGRYREVIIGEGPKVPIIASIGLYSVSLGNPGTTFFNFFGTRVSTIYIHIFSLIVMIVCILLAIMSRKTKMVLATSVIFSGALGNTIDRLLYHGVVRDIFTFTWHNGVWNLADAYVISTVCVAAGAFIWYNILHMCLQRKMRTQRFVAKINDNDGLTACP